MAHTFLIMAQHILLLFSTAMPTTLTTNAAAAAAGTPTTLATRPLLRHLAAAVMPTSPEGRCRCANHPRDQGYCCHTYRSRHHVHHSCKWAFLFTPREVTLHEQLCINIDYYNMEKKKLATLPAISVASILAVSSSAFLNTTCSRICTIIIHINLFFHQLS